MSCIIEDNAVVLFQGDSITDWGRDYNNASSLGNGYVMIIDALFSAVCPEKKVTFINRGISGNRVKDLQERWKKDCLDLNPSWVSILIGINDCGINYTSEEDFENSYRDILVQTKTKTKAGIIIMEPFVLPVSDYRNKWREDLNPKINIIRKLAREFATYYIPLDGIFAQASVIRELDFWSSDGVHLTQAGNALVAKAWLNTVGINITV